MNIFGLPTTLEQAPLVLLPVPWEVTTTYGSGTSRGPEIINEASMQVDFWDSTFGNIVEQRGVYLAPEFNDIKSINDRLKPRAQEYIFNPEKLNAKESRDLVKEINDASEVVNDFVYLKARDFLQQNKLVGVVGGDHSSPLGLIRALSETYNRDFGVLHFDAHADLRKAYQGFNYSHASIMYNVMSAPFAPKKLVQIGIRDFCEEEYVRSERSQGKIKTYYDESIKEQMLSGTNWATIVDSLISELPQNIYISFDIDGLDPALCPSTGTPVAGGLSFAETNFIFKRLLQAKKRIIGFDLCEVSNAGNSEGEWDANVGARILFKLCSLTLSAQN